MTGCPMNKIFSGQKGIKFRKHFVYNLCQNALGEISLKIAKFRKINILNFIFRIHPSEYSICVLIGFMSVKR
jgi:hypothetical protein